jgi:transketolase
VASGLSLSDLRILWSTYLTFSDYARPAIRLSALMRLPVIHLFTHDSIGLGEDGPTHQPIEQLAALRAMPGLDVIRPCDANEVAYAWRAALDRSHDPVALVMTRQDVPVLDRSDLGSAEGVLKGGYVLAAEEGDLEAILIATGSEVAPTLEAQRLLVSDGRKGVRVVSLPCWEIFDRQDDAYREEVLPSSVTARLAVEAGSSFGWERYVGEQGKVVSMDRFGESAPATALQERFGYTPGSIAESLRDLLA